MAEDRVVLDASALLCIFNNERGAEAIIPHLADAAISTVNLTEIWAKWAEKPLVPAERLAEAINDLQLDVIDFDAEQARHSGLLRAETRAQGLSLGDRACLALALKLKAPVVTTDRIWAKLDVGVKVIVAR